MADSPSALTQEGRIVLRRTGEAQLNLVLLHALETAHAVTIDPDTLRTDEDEDGNAPAELAGVLARLQAAAAQVRRRQHQFGCATTVRPQGARNEDGDGHGSSRIVEGPTTCLFPSLRAANQEVISTLLVGYGCWAATPAPRYRAL